MLAFFNYPVNLIGSVALEQLKKALTIRHVNTDKYLDENLVRFELLFGPNFFLLLVLFS